MPLAPLITQIVGSYVKPHWLANHQRAGAYDGSWWRPDAEVLDEARDDAARLAIYEQERAGLDLVTDGEMRRTNYDRHYLGGLDGIDFTTLVPVKRPSEHNADGPDSTGMEEYVALNQLGPRVVAPVAWRRAMAVDELRFLKRHARRPVKVTVAGPVSLSRRVSDAHYGDEDALILAFARALNQEMRALQSEGADVLQIDEPAFHASFSVAERIGGTALATMVDGITVPVIVHVCYGYALVHKEKAASALYPKALELLAACPIAGISLEYEQPGHAPDLLQSCGDKHVVLGLLDLARQEAETAAHVAARLTAALEVVPAERLHPASDCGMWYLPRALAFAKLTALVEGTNAVRDRTAKRWG